MTVQSWTLDLTIARSYIESPRPDGVTFAPSHPIGRRGFRIMPEDLNRIGRVASPTSPRVVYGWEPRAMPVVGLMVPAGARLRPHRMPFAPMLRSNFGRNF